MSISVQAIASGSNGNSFVVANETEALLIDAGISRKRIIDGLNKINIPKENVKGVLITHAHSDHISGLPVLTQYLENADLFATSATISELYVMSNYDSKWYDIAKNTTCISQSKINEIGNFKIKTVKAKHDSPGTVGYRIHHKFENTAGVTISVLTDTGKLEEREIWQLSRSDLVLLESNYDKVLLKKSSRPWQLKDRIRSFHLSNNETYNVLSKLLTYKSSRRIKGVMLGHLSGECNSTNIIRSLVRTWEKHNEKPFVDWNWFLCPRDNSSDYLSISPEEISVEKKFSGVIDY